MTSSFTILYFFNCLLYVISIFVQKKSLSNKVRDFTKEDKNTTNNEESEIKFAARRPVVLYTNLKVALEVSKFGDNTELLCVLKTFDSTKHE